MLTGDARVILRNTARPSTPFDPVFIDAEKDNYIEHFDTAWPLLRPGAIMLADNVTSHDLTDYQAMAAHRFDAETVTITIGRGVEMTRKLAAP